MKTALLLALLGACVALSSACHGGYKYECVKDYYPKKCTAVKVCENAKKEKCGYDYCGYGYVCASQKKKVCKNFLALKEKCESKKVCKEVKKPCGYDYCGYDEECVKDKVCKVVHGYGRRLMGGEASADSSAHAYGKDAKAVSYASAHAGSGYYPGKKYGKVYFDKCDYCKKKEKLECYDAYSCVKKEPCKDVIEKKCVKDVLRPGYDVCHGGKEFTYDEGYSYGDKCGHEYCGEGYKCADVYYQRCSTPCGHDYCGYGYECVADYDDDCKDYAYLETVCRDVYEPTCIPLGHYGLDYYYPKCKTVYKCDEYENICGDKYCGYGYSCALKECGGYKDPYADYGYYPEYYYYGGKDDYYGGKDDYYGGYDGHYGGHDGHYDGYDGYHHDKDPYYHDDDYYPKKESGSAYVSSSSHAGPHGSSTHTESHTTGSGKGHATAHGSTKGGHSGSNTYSGHGQAATHTYADDYRPYDYEGHSASGYGSHEDESKDYYHP